VALFSHALWRGATPTLFGFGKPTRDYVHVHDVARALLMALGQGGEFNVSTGVETSVSRVFELLRSAADSTIEGDLAALRPGELERSCIDSSRARDQLGWGAEVGVEEGLSATYRALVEEFELENARAAG
jgi:UDP-glucose 4-epimerase